MPISILLVRQSLQSSNMNQHGIIIRVATILICSSFAIGLLIFLLYPQFYIRLFLLGTVWANFSAETTPGVYVMPVQMSVSTKAQVERIGFGIDEGTRLSFLKYEVRVPWKGIDKEIIKDSTACFQFVSHRAVCFSENVDLKKAMMGKLSEKDRVILRNVWTDPLQLDSLRKQVRMPDGKGKGSHHGREKKIYRNFQAAGSGGAVE